MTPRPQESPAHLHDRFLLFHLVRAGAWRLLRARAMAGRSGREHRGVFISARVASSAGWAGRQRSGVWPHAHSSPTGHSQQLPENGLQAPVRSPWLPAQGVGGRGLGLQLHQAPLPGVCPQTGWGLPKHLLMYGRGPKQSEGAQPQLGPLPTLPASHRTHSPMALCVTHMSGDRHVSISQPY